MPATQVKFPDTTTQLIRREHGFFPVSGEVTSDNWGISAIHWAFKRQAQKYLKQILTSMK